MKTMILFIVLIMAASSFAFSPKPDLSRHLSLGTQGYACYSTVNKPAARCRTATAAGVATVSKFFMNGSETYVMPSSDETIDNTKRNITSFCQRAYSSASPLTSHCWGE